MAIFNSYVTNYQRVYVLMYKSFIRFIKASVVYQLTHFKNIEIACEQDMFLLSHKAFC